MNTQGMDQMLRDLRAMSAAAGAGRAGEAGPAASGGATPDFAQLLRSSIESVNRAQQEAGRLQRAFDANAPGANLQEVVVAMQKASLSFQTMVQVRNRLVSAYQEIMATQV
jgi:flagellar hook-basal body complex protein FliE